MSVSPLECWRTTGTLSCWSGPLSLVVNLLLHVTILWVFLTVFFFYYIARLTESHVNDELQTVMTDQTAQLLASLDAQDTRGQLPWARIESVAQRLARESAQPSQRVQENNATLYHETLCTAFALGLTLVLLTLYFLLRRVDVKVGWLLLENVVIFSCVGVVELYFFTQIASQYVPIYPDEALKAATSSLVAQLSHAN